MATKYPIVLAHGVVLKDVGRFKAFGKIEDVLKKQGYAVFNADHDGLGSIENNAVQLKRFIGKILGQTGAERVNVIAHSKGGLDTLYMIDRLGMADQIASLTFLSTPHRGSAFSEFLYRLPRILRAPLAFSFDLLYRVLGDEKPQALTVCRQLCAAEEDAVILENAADCAHIYMQSFSSTLKRSRDDLVMGFPLVISKRRGYAPCDGMVSAESSKYGRYRGDCTPLSLSHREIVDFMVRGEKRRAVHAFYLSVARELEEMGL